METASPFQEQTFFSSPQSFVGKLRWWLRLLVLVFCGMLAYYSPSVRIFLTALALLAVVFIVPFEVLMRRILQTRRPRITLTSQTISAPGFKGMIKEYPWESITQASLQVRQGYMGWLVLTLKDTSKPARLSLSTISPEDQSQLLRSIAHQLHAHHPGTSTMPPRLHNALEESLLFKSELKASMPVTWALWLVVGLNIAVELFLIFFGGVDLLQANTAQLLRWGGNSASEVQRGEYWRLLTATFLHTGIVHLAANLIGLISAGLTVERLYGHRAFLLIYLGSALIGNAVSLYFSAQQNVCVGASGAVFGLASALVVALIRHRKTLPSAFRQEALGLGIFMVAAFFEGFVSQRSIDNSAHIGGLLAGLLIAYGVPEKIDTARFKRLFTARAWIAVGLITALTACLVAFAPRAQIDHKQLFQSQEIFRQAATRFQKTMQSMAKDQQLMQERQLTPRQWDERAKAYYVPELQATLKLLDQTRFPPNVPQQVMIPLMRRSLILWIEILSMPSNYTAGSELPQLSDPARAKAINQELTTIYLQMRSLVPPPQTKPPPPPPR